MRGYLDLFLLFYRCFSWLKNIILSLEHSCLFFMQSFDRWNPSYIFFILSCFFGFLPVLEGYLLKTSLSLIYY